MVGELDWSTGCLPHSQRHVTEMHILQHPSLSEDRIEQLMASLNKAREQSEQYARCRLELREVENEPPTSTVDRSALNPVEKIGKGPGDKHSMSTQALCQAAKKVCVPSASAAAVCWCDFPVSSPKICRHPTQKCFNLVMSHLFCRLAPFQQEPATIHWPEL